MTTFDRLGSTSNFTPRKYRIQILFKEVDLQVFIETTPTTSTHLKDLAKHNKKETNVNQIIIDLMKDHLIPHIVEKKVGKEMFDALVIFMHKLAIKELTR